MKSNNFILASASPRRLELLNQIGIVPYKIEPPDINEDLKFKENPKNYTLRIAKEKAQKVFKKFPESFVLAGDTIVSKGKRIFFKPKDQQEAYESLKILSGKRHKVYSALSIINPNKIEFTKYSVTTVKFAQITEKELQHYLNLNEWKGKAGSYALQGYGAKFIQWIQGSPSGVIGMPLYELKNLLTSAGWKNGI